ncbi:MAG: hypothetical protein KDB90_12275 [Planctomycetes bacterium]|nr:hypothetical protein [Planctomycetota bacterium]
MLDGVTLTVGGTGDFVNDLDPTTGISVWVDDGDGQFNSSLDTMVGSSGGASPTITVNFGSSLSVSSAATMDIWVVGSFLAAAGASIPDTYQVSIAAPGDVNVQSPATVSLGTPSPDSDVLSVVVFFVTSITPTGGSGGEAFQIDGSGFTPPVSVTIGGVDLGVGTANGSYTSAFGWVTPDLGSTGDYNIVVTTSELGPVTIAQTYHHAKKERHAGVGATCTTSDHTRMYGMMSVAALAILMVLVRAVGGTKKGSGYFIGPYF